MPAIIIQNDDEFFEKFKEGLTGFLTQHPEYATIDGKASGYFSISQQKLHLSRTYTFKILLTPLGTNEATRIPCPSSVKVSLDNLEPIIINHLKSLGFHYGKEAASSEIITQDLQLQLHRLFEKYPKRYPKTEGTRGIFTAILRVPDTPDSSYAIRVNLHPILDIGRAKTEHILAADEISVTLISIKDQETARHVLDSVQIALEQNRFTEREIEAQHNDKKIIPAGWIELDDIKILPSSQHKTFIIQLVRQRQKEGEGKIPIIRFSSGTEKNRPEQAEIILSAAKEFIATALEADKPISISSIKDGLQKQGFITSRTYERGDTLQARDIRTIYCENKPILQLFTAYNTEQGDGTYITNFRITPTNGSSYTPLTKIIPTGTANPTVAGTRRKILYDFVEGVLALYFQQNPDQEILTEMRSARGKMVNAIKLQHDVEATAEDRHHFIDGNGLKEVIGQLLEHARDHFWSITYAPIDVTMPKVDRRLRPNVCIILMSLCLRIWLHMINPSLFLQKARQGQRRLRRRLFPLCLAPKIDQVMRSQT